MVVLLRAANMSAVPGFQAFLQQSCKPCIETTTKILQNGSTVGGYICMGGICFNFMKIGGVGCYIFDQVFASISNVSVFVFKTTVKRLQNGWESVFNVIS